MALLSIRSRASAAIPTSSMADIAFLLLIFFLVTTVFDEEQGLPMVLPERAEPQEISPANLLFLTITADGRVTVRNGESQQERRIRSSEIESLWIDEVARNPNLIAAVQTHTEARYEHMIDVLDALQTAGATRISLQLLEP